MRRWLHFWRRHLLENDELSIYYTKREQCQLMPVETTTVFTYVVSHQLIMVRELNVQSIDAQYR